MAIDDILNAINSHNIIEISYVDKEGNSSIRSVEPYEIKNNKLYAYCLQRKATRAFLVSNIRSVKVIDKHFAPRW